VLIILFVQCYSVRAQLLSTTQIDSILRTEASAKTKIEYKAFLRGVYPMIISLLPINGNIIGTMTYGSEKHTSYLEGSQTDKGMVLQEIDSNEELCGSLLLDYAEYPWKLNGQWLNVDQTRGYPIFLIASHKTKEEVEFKIKKYMGRDNHYAELYVYPLQGDAEILARFHDGKCYYLLEKQTTSNVQIQGTLNGKETQILWDKKDLKLQDKNNNSESYKFARELSLYQEHEMSYSEVLDVRIPVLQDEYFNGIMKNLLQEHLLNSSCNHGSNDPEFHWWHQRFASVDIHYLDKNLLSFKLHLINSCSDKDQVYFFNYDRKKEQLVLLHNLRLKNSVVAQAIQRFYAIHSTHPTDVLLDAHGLTIFGPYDLIYGYPQIRLSLNELQIKNIQKLLN
jgi:hypothetical protein